VTITHPEQWIEAAEVQGFPTEGEFATELWRRTHSTYCLPYDEAAWLLRKCGYIPFCGYPLARSGKVRTMTREQVMQAWETNPLLAKYCTKQYPSIDEEGDR
jgi:hypothetical protein